MPRWLEDVLLAAGVLAATAFAAEPAAALARRRKASGPAQATSSASATGPAAATSSAPATRPGRTHWPASVVRPAWHFAPAALPGHARSQAGQARIILADHERLVVTYCPSDHAVYVLGPPGEDPRDVLSAARLVLPEETYQDLADHLGVPAAWPLE
jgi:hypothetical protein